MGESLHFCQITQCCSREFQDDSEPQMERTKAGPVISQVAWLLQHRDAQMSQVYIT